MLVDSQGDAGCECKRGILPWFVMGHHHLVNNGNCLLPQHTSTDNVNEWQHLCPITQCVITHCVFSKTWLVSSV